MRLYLVQHGEALAKDIDPERSLSEKGRRDVERLAAFLGGRAIRVARVLHSGKKRARETAQLLAAAMSPGAEAEAVAGLDPNDPVEPLAEQVSGWQQDAVLVGHLPFMDRFVARLIAGGEGAVVFRPATMVCLERAEAGAWSLAWMLPPELLA